MAARRRIYSVFDSLVRDGKSLVIVSSDLDELFETCDRIGVMSAGRMVAIFNRSDWTEEKIMHAAFAGYQRPASQRHTSNLANAGARESGSSSQRTASANDADVGDQIQ
jgi:ABC-type multidrug transport system ATPase subunit